MANTNVYPYGQNQEMPAGFQIANDLNTNSAQQSLSAAMGKRLREGNRIRVAASDAPDYQKAVADYQCTGTNDELVIQQAVNDIYTLGGGTIHLSMGTFSIDSFPNQDAHDDGGSYTAILIPSNNSTGYEIRIAGTTLPYGMASQNGTKIVVSETCYRSLDNSTPYKIFRSTYAPKLNGYARLSLFISDIGVQIPWNQKKIMCIDLLYCNRVLMQSVLCRGYISGFDGHVITGGNPPAVAVQGCVGIRMTGGSNYGVLCDYRNVACAGFYEGFQVGGEHVVGINLSGVHNVYSYTFGNYPWQEAFHHPITLINCCDERSVNLPYFAYCGGDKNNGAGGQQISLIDFNLERYAPHTPGGVLGESATELVPGTFHGDISYTIQVQGTNVTNMKFWKDGHGQRFISRNSAHKLACSTAERSSYAANYMQHVYDTDMNKELICVDTANKVWKDTMGNTVNNS